MPSFDSIIVGEDWISEHYFTTDSTKESFQGEVLKRRKLWDEDSKAGHSTTLTRFSQHRGELQVRLAELAEDPSGAHEAYNLLRTALGFNGTVSALTAQRSGTETVIPFVWNGAGGEILFLESAPADSIEDFLGASRPLGRVIADGKEDTERTTAKLISELYLADTPPKYIVAMAGKWLVLTEQERWAEGRYLAADVLLVADRNDGKKGQEIDRFLTALGRDALMPSPDGTIWWDEILESSVNHTVGVSKDLREGIRRSIEIIANDVLARRATTDTELEAIDGQVLARQSLRFLYRILFLLYAEASPELGVLPVGAGEYNEGYGLDRLRELTLVEIHDDSSLRGTHIFESLNGLFRLVDSGHNPLTGLDEGTETSANEGLRFDALKADLFAPTATSLINETKLSNGELQRVLQHLLLSRESRGKDRGFISYAELGINQLGAVYEGLMSYTGFIAETDLHEVAKDGDASKGSWVVPTDRSDSVESKHFVKERNERTGDLETVVHRKGSFVFRLAGRERQQSASYYTPEVLTKFVVSQALEELLDQAGTATPADDILKLTVCEPALGSGAFAIEAVRQLAGEYLKRKQDELDVQIPADEYPRELQKVKAQIALHQVHGVDLNSTAVELAEVSLWLDTMVKDLEAPWFGLRLRRGNSLIGARRATYSRQSVNDKSWLNSAPQDAPLTGLVDAMHRETDDAAVAGRIHHFLLPAAGWGAASDTKEVKELANDAQQRLKVWRKQALNQPTKAQIDRFAKLSNRVEILWKYALRRLQIADAGARRNIDYFGRSGSAEIRGEDGDATPVTRTQIEDALGNQNGAFQRLRRVMDAWNALWFWPITEAKTKGQQPPSIDEWIEALEGILGRMDYLPLADRNFGRAKGQEILAPSMTWEDLDISEPLAIAGSRAIGIEQVLRDHPWLKVCEDVAKDQGFFHWELDFASVFGGGGFDLQVGNPPWVRPRFEEAPLLAEFDPWWQLAPKTDQPTRMARREATLDSFEKRSSFIDSVVSSSLASRYLGDTTVFPLLKGLQPDLYRCFMPLVWRNASKRGVSALIHLETHFTDENAGSLRKASYLRLRRHWQFINELQLFEIQDQKRYGVNIYGASRSAPSFLHAVSLYHPVMVERSMKHQGDGPEPGIKDELGRWDQTPHSGRISLVSGPELQGWSEILDYGPDDYLQTPMVYAVNRSTDIVLRKLARCDRMSQLPLVMSKGLDESTDRKKGLLDIEWGSPGSWDQVILQGPHLYVADPFYKRPNASMLHQQDWTPNDLEVLGVSAIPITCWMPRGVKDSDLSVDLSANDHYRVAWRGMAPNTGERTFVPAIIPPKAGHLRTVQAVAIPERSGFELAQMASFASSILSDFSVRSSPKSHILGSTFARLPYLEDFPLTDLLVLRTLRLNCLTEAYAGLWSSAYRDVFTHDRWVLDCSDEPSSLGDVAAAWDEQTPLRRAEQRRAAQVEIDALVALASGVTADELCTIYRSQFPVLHGYERYAFYDSKGRKVPRALNTLYRQQGESLTIEDRSWKHPESGVEYVFEFPFRSFDREDDMKKAYSHFAQLLDEKQIEELAK